MCVAAYRRVRASEDLCNLAVRHLLEVTQRDDRALPWWQRPDGFEHRRTLHQAVEMVVCRVALGEVPPQPRRTPGLTDDRVDERAAGIEVGTVHVGDARPVPIE